MTAQAQDGRLDSMRAAGCIATDGASGGAGGAGALLNALNGASANANCTSTPPFNGGGGGGAAGRIRVNTATGSFAPSGGAIVSPGASVGQVNVR